MSVLSPGGELAATIEAFRIANAPTPAPRPHATGAPAAPSALAPEPPHPHATTFGPQPTPNARATATPEQAPAPAPEVIVDIGSSPSRPAPQAAYLRAVAELLAAPQGRLAPAVPGPPPAVSPPPSLPMAPLAFPSVPLPGPPSLPLASAPQVPPAVPPPVAPGLPSAVVPAPPAAAETEPLSPPPIPPTVLAMARAALDAAYLGAAKGDRLAAALIAKAPPEAIFATLDRRSLFAIAVDETFAPVERRAARAWLARVAGEILSALPETATPRVRIDGLSAFIVHLEAAGPEEQISPEWLVQRAAAGMARDRALAAAGGDVEQPADSRPLLAAVRAALEAPAPAIPAAAVPAASSRDAPLLGTFYLSPEMLLAGLAAIQRLQQRRPEVPDDPARRRRSGADLDGLRILPLEASWEQVEDAGPAIEAFEQASGRSLPEDYRAFLKRFNGGRLYPNMFAYSVGALYGSTTPAMTFFDRLHEWATVEATWSGERFGGAAPPEMLAIGADPGGLEIMLSLRADSFGAVFCWPHSSEPWGASANRKAYLLASSFEDFLDTLDDVEEGAGFRYWSRPALRRLVRFIER